MHFLRRITFTVIGNWKFWLPIYENVWRMLCDCKMIRNTVCRTILFMVWWTVLSSSHQAAWVRSPSKKCFLVIRGGVQMSCEVTRAQIVKSIVKHNVSRRLNVRDNPQFNKAPLFAKNFRQELLSLWAFYSFVATGGPFAKDTICGSLL